MFINKSNFKSAFTLAEVLVTLMIIGVIASMTIPSLKKNAEMQENVVGLKKAYSTLNQATSQLEQKYGDFKRWRFTDGTNEEINRMVKYYTSVMNVSRVCESNKNGCWSQTKDLSGKNVGNSYGIGTNIASFSTTDGMNFSLDGTGSFSGIDAKSAPSGSLGFFVDVNGDKKPNQMGVDVFFFVMTKDRGLLPAGTDDGGSDCAAGKVGNTCAAKVLKEGKIDY